MKAILQQMRKMNEDEDEENENLGGMQKQLKEERIDGVTLMILHNNTN